MTAAPYRVGWCPGALRPMRVGDGLLLRIKPRAHRLTPDQANALAALARRHGHGAMTLTARGNVQLRGLSEDALPAVHEALGALDLLDGSPEGEACRNVVSNPLAGRDPDAVADLSAAVAALEARLSDDPALHRLPAKFNWVVDDGGRLGPADVDGDVRFTADRTPEGMRLLVTLAGGNDAARCEPDALPAVAARLARAFLHVCEANGCPPHRMRDLVALVGDRVVLEVAGLDPCRAPVPDRTRRGEPVGVHRVGDTVVLGAAPAFGLLAAADLGAFAQAACRAGAPDIRLTPWRSLLAPVPDEAAAFGMEEALRGTALMVDPADPRLSVAACVGAPACRRGTTPVPVDAARLASMLGRRPAARIRLHVSGCPKGCAHPGAAPLTLVGRDGAYDLVSDDTPAGAPQRRGLSLDDVVALLRPPENAP